MEYTVRYSIEIDADNPVDAARKVHRIVTDTQDPAAQWSYAVTPFTSRWPDEKEEIVTLNRDGREI